MHSALLLVCIFISQRQKKTFHGCPVKQVAETNFLWFGRLLNFTV